MRKSLIGIGLIIASPAWAGSGMQQQLPGITPAIVRSGQMELPLDQTLMHIPSVTTTCGGETVRPTYTDDLAVEASRFDNGQRTDVVLDFSVAEDGRTIDIRPRTSASNDVILAVQSGQTQTQQAALAAWRFAGPARSDCQMTVHYESSPLNEASQPALLRYLAVTRTTGPVRDAVAARLAGPNANCGGDRRGNRRPRTVSFPDNMVGQRPPPGGRSWTVLRWNMDANGRAEAVETLGSSGDTEFDAETRRAVSETVAEGGTPLTGCIYNFYRSGPVLPAPPVPPTQDDPLQNCPAEVGARFQARNTPQDYSSTFRSRGIEGWALMRFDFATWGQVGNVTVIDAQPAAAFGDMGRNAIQSGRAREGFNAGVRCVMPVRYRMQESLDAASASGLDSSAD